MRLVSYFMTLYLFTLLFCTAPPKLSSVSSSILVYHILTPSSGSSERSCVVHLKNQNTKFEYEGTYFKDGYGYIFDLPEGNYRIMRLLVPSPQGTIIISDSLFFRPFFITMNQIQFIGNYSITLKPGTPESKLELRRDKKTEQADLQVLSEIKFLKKFGMTISGEVPKVFASDYISDLLRKK